MGWHSSDTAELNFDQVKVPIENLIGEEGKGFHYLMNGLQLERLCFIPGSVANMEFAIDSALQYMSERKAFGKTINKFQVLRHRAAQMAAEIEAAKQFVAIRKVCRKVGSSDLKIASIALVNDALLLTANTRDFEKVPGLRYENWLT